MRKRRENGSESCDIIREYTENVITTYIFGISHLMRDMLKC